MVTFDSADPGTDPADWLRSPVVLGAQPRDAAEYRSLVVAVAHPDDETLAAGGLIARFAASARPVTVIVATDGSGSHPDSPTTTPAELSARRSDELRAAVAILAPAADLIELGLPDGGLADRHDRIVAEIRGRLSDGALLVSTAVDDGHPDHEAVARAAVDAAGGRDHWQAPIWFWHWGEPGRDPARRATAIALTPEERSRKARASAAHGSQIAPLSPLPGDEALLSRRFLTNFDRDTETFFAAGDYRADGGAPRAGEALTREFFDEFYTQGDDPWGFETRWYEERKRAILLASLPRQRFASALELGSSNGVLTADLAGRVDALLATDIVEAPLEVARRRLADSPHVRFERRTLPAEWPDGRFDLIVMSEMGYYLDARSLHRLIRLCRQSLTADGVLVACHWRHPVAEYPLSGDAVHAALEGSGIPIIANHLEADFRLEVRSSDGASVAQRTGLA
ncbi:PIG-L family deacetylase [Amnibacterium flavum]|uniref:SAM-dependent methyltransferase n=1 Tax=Amnibacterium flavum TaxID=2173173 RepID=A0A2V1HYS5_9MICO|nr:bifunctional PIG-L family deacetylase/class I SAM-dependent methyltransferase [Amnibacterium flavum]PVZ96017.1 hypothetical protein DDQ50_06125 [Amnibacterium flavum]